ncbi:MAG: endolytic transglycosylase MltG [Candidatus Rokubacteria bacterium]|nr:endolytic transglycosylase MltG [Candidatus Rokubacteria bacterium]
MRLRGVALLALMGLAALGLEAWRVLTPPAPLRDGPRLVEIPANVSVTEIARRLTRAGVIRSPEGFVLLSFAHGSRRSLKAGEYEIPRGASTPEVLARLEGGRVRQHAVLHPEGATVIELGRVLEATRLAGATDIARVARDPAFLRAHGIEAESAEGYLFPDTYHFARGMTPGQLLGRMIQRMQAKLTPDIRARARARGLSVHELLTLASIIEREAVVPGERRLISAVFWNRLKLGMPLQADPTVQYAAGKERRALARVDLQTDHPYNTYQRPGLPPGPIASPGLDAIAAALDPAPVTYLYFVAKDNHRHHFSTTLEEHQRAVTRYRLARSR